jgi:IclR family acetate operon transcriptional repressor
VVEEETGNGAAYPIRAVERVCDILDTLREAKEGATLMAVAGAVSVPKSTAYRYLLSLEGRRYVEREPDSGLFRLGLAFRPQNSFQLDLFVERARPELEHLRDRLNETVNIGVLDAGQVVHVAVIECAQMMRLAARVGERGPIHATALGKVISAELPRDRVKSILASEGMQPLTDRTITTVDGFFDELDRVARAGYALDDLEAQSDGRCVAVPLAGLPFPGGLSISAPATRLAHADVPRVVEHLRRSAAVLVAGYQAIPT